MNRRIRLILSLVLIGAGIYALYTAYDAYLSSGREVARLNLSGGGAKQAAVRLDRGMNPLRAVLEVDYAMTYRGSVPVLFESKVTVTDTAGKPVWIGRTIQRDDKTDHSDQYGAETLRKELGDFTVTDAGTYGLTWSLTPKTAQVNAAVLILRAGAAPLEWRRMALGGVLVAVGVLSLFVRRRA